MTSLTMIITIVGSILIPLASGFLILITKVVRLEGGQNTIYAKIEGIEKVQDFYIKNIEIQTSLLMRMTQDMSDIKESIAELKEFKAYVDYRLNEKKKDN